MRLTKAQREMLAWAGRGYVLLRPSWTRWRLHRKGLIAPWLFEGSWALTVQGETVLAALTGEKPR